MSLKVLELNHVALHVSDLEASVRFYTDILELPAIPRPNFPFPGAWFALANQELHLIADPELIPANRRHHHFALLVQNVYAAQEILIAKGVTGMLGPSPRPDGPMQLFVFDPDGYRIELYSMPEN